MREIKFRAWDKRDLGGMLSTKYVMEHLDYIFNTRHTHTLMQFTGLHDKNGKEIWEKDKVIISVVGDSTYPATVIFKDGAFRCSYFGRTLPTKPHEIEVIGNEFEK